MTARFLCLLGSLAFGGLALASPTALTPTEATRVNDSIRRFYQPGADPAVMNERIPKFSLRTNSVVRRHASLRLKTPSKNPLLELAQKKGTESFRRQECEQVLKKKFPGLRCDDTAPRTWAAAEESDLLADLAKGWIDSDKLAHDLDSVPSKGETSMDLWSDDYWRTRFGGVSYRYSDPVEYETWEEASEAYAQPKAWNRLVERAKTDEDLDKAIVNWSPAEKYDLSLHDEKFTLTNQQKELGEEFLGDDGKVEDWLGLCHGWAAAAIMIPRPQKTVKTWGPERSLVTWYPNDIKSLASLMWAVGDSDNNFAGYKCEVTHPATFQNGRIQEQDCFDTNPGTFHLALGNLVGKNKLSFIMDSTFDYEIWNQPMQSYEFTYFNPIQPEKRSKNWSDVAVPYDANFKENDRFQKPLTRGTIKDDGSRDDSAIKQMVGVIATVVYMAETEPPDHSEAADGDATDRATYTYDLELGEKDGKLVVTGGEWHENGHPDFLWLPQKGSFALSKFDEDKVDFTGEKTVDDETTRHARRASRNGFPLCEVVSTLVEKSVGTKVKLCPGA